MPGQNPRIISWQTGDDNGEGLSLDDARDDIGWLGAKGGLQ
jgi:hypothetical protein